MKQQKAPQRKFFLFALAAVLCIGLFVFALALYGRHQMSKIPSLSVQEVIDYTTQNDPDAVITVGIIQNGEMSYTVYGENGSRLPNELHTYEVGSITKTFTAALINKALQEGKLSLSDSIDQYLSLPGDKAYPTLQQLLTHTSGYKGYYFEMPMISNFFAGRNDFYGISKAQVLKKAASVSLANKEYPFAYSNFGYAVLGLVLEEIYQQDYTALMNHFVQQELQLPQTKLADGMGDLANYWDWQADDAYRSAGALYSNINDMLLYAQMQLQRQQPFAQCHTSLEKIDASTKSYKAMGIHMDEIGMGWIIDIQNGFIWHNGGTSNYNSYIGFNPQTQTAVVVLSNLSPNKKIPATVLGVKLLSSLQ